MYSKERKLIVLPPNIESIEYVYIMHARSVMQQKKRKKKKRGKTEGKEKR